MEQEESKITEVSNSLLYSKGNPLTEDSSEREKPTPYKIEIKDASIGVTENILDQFGEFTLR